MALHDVDQKILSRLAKGTEQSNPPLAAALYKLLGLSVLLARRLIRARRLRRDPPTNEAKTETLHHHIIWLAREGLQITEIFVFPHTADMQHGPLLRVLSSKLRASFYHVFALFHNTPPVRLFSPSLARSPPPQAQSVVPLSPTQGNGSRRKTPEEPPPQTKEGDEPIEGDKENQPEARPRDSKSGPRDPIFSMISDSSNVTNPWANINVISPPPGFGAGAQEQQVANPAAFLLPSVDFLPGTTAAFKDAASLASGLLTGSAPLRLSVYLEQCAFLWDCLHDHKGSRRLAAQTIKNVYESQDPMSDADFEDAAQLVATLGRMMRRKSYEGTPRFGPGSPTNPATSGDLRALSQFTNINPPPMPRIAPSHAPSAPNMSIPRRPVGTPPGSRATSRSASSIPRPTRGNGNEGRPRTR